MMKKTVTDNQPVTKKEFRESNNAVQNQFEKIDKRFDEIESKMVTKDDAKNFATKDDIKSVNEKISNLAMVVVKNSEDIVNIKETITTKLATKDDINRIMSAIDKFSSKDEGYGRKAEVNTHRLNEIEPKVEDHEKRIHVLEAHGK
jgi:predicted  nucleic acid-binding Zn-ribbon protein